MYWYKIVDKDRDGNFKMLFHGIKGSRIIPIGEWLKSEQKLVRDGSIGTQYKSGWHVMKDINSIKEYLSRFTSISGNERIIIKVAVRGKIWPKEHSPSDVYLCEEIMVIGEI